MRIYLNARGLDKERMLVIPFLLLLFREAGAEREKCLDSKGNRGGLMPLRTELLVRWWPHEKQQQSSRLLLWRWVLVCAIPQCLSKWQCPKLCVPWKTACVLPRVQCGVSCTGLLYFLHRHLGTLKHWVTALWTKEVSLALKILVRLFDWRRVVQPGCLTKMFVTGLCFPDSMWKIELQLNALHYFYKLSAC